MDVLNHRCAEILRTLHQFQQDGYLCDTMLVAEDGELRAHGAVLAAASPFLRELLTSTEKPMQHVIVLSEFRSDILQIVLHFIYSGTLNIPDKYLVNDIITKIIIALQKFELKMSARAENHATKLMQTLYQFQNDGYLCDTMLVAEDSRLKAHSIVLAADSTLFKSRPPHSDKPVEHTIVLAEYQSHFVRAALRFIYCANLSTPATIRTTSQKLGNTIQDSNSRSANHVESCTSFDKMSPRSAIETRSCINQEVVTGSKVIGFVSEQSSEPNCLKAETAEVSSEFNIDNVVLSTSTTLHPPVYLSKMLTTDTSICQVVASNEETMTEVLEKLKQKLEIEQKPEPHTTTTNDIDTCQQISPNRKSCGQISAKQETEKPNIFSCICGICGKKFSNTKYLRLHRQVHWGSPETVQCTVCGVTILYKKNLQTHMKIHNNSLNRDSRRVCSHCGCSFTPRHRRLNHSRSSIDCSRLCDVCRKRAYKKIDFTCMVCGKKIVYKRNAVNHMKHHPGNWSHLFPKRKVLRQPGNVTCTVCGINISTKANLRRHIKRHHTSKTREKREKTSDKIDLTSRHCPVCGKVFLYKKNMYHHMRKSHAGKWCSIFSEQKNTTQNHTIELPYICQTCWHGFQSRQALHIHMQQCNCDFRSKYSVLLLLLFLLEASSGVLTYLYEYKIHKEVSHQMNYTLLHRYGVDPVAKLSVDHMQAYKRCCGCSSYTDWFVSDWYKSVLTNETRLVPDSCCKTVTAGCGSRVNPNNINYGGCLVHMEDEFRIHLNIMSALGMGLCCLQIFGIIFACCLAKRVRKWATRNETSYWQQ